MLIFFIYMGLLPVNIAVPKWSILKLNKNKENDC